MEYIKYFTSNTFNRTDFVNMLRHKMGVNACLGRDGIFLDRDKFNECRAAEMPHWAFLNREDINSVLHTRPINPEEVYGFALMKPNDTEIVFTSSSLFCAGVLLKKYAEENNISTALIDLGTGEIIQEYVR